MGQWRILALDALTPFTYRTMSKAKAELHAFQLSFTNGSPQLLGNVKNHFARPDLKDGTYIRTSRVLRMDFERMEAETLNTIYKLAYPAEP